MSPSPATWAEAVRGQQPPVSSSHLPPPAARLLQLYKECVARGTWARLVFETNGGEEEFFMYRRPTLYPLEIAVDFLKSL